MNPENSQPPIPRGFQTLDTLHLRAGAPTPKFAPIVSSVKPATRPGWLVLDISLAPGNNVRVEVSESRYTPDAVRAILSAAPSLYAPAGLTSNLWAQE